MGFSSFDDSLVIIYSFLQNYFLEPLAFFLFFFFSFFLFWIPNVYDDYAKFDYL